MNLLPCRHCGKLKPAREVMTRFLVLGHEGKQVRFRMCDSCRKEATKSYRKGKVTT